MKLVSTFIDYYDHFFDREGPVFVRAGGSTGPSRREQHLLLERAGFLVPPRGYVGEVMGSPWEAEGISRIQVVVAYTDEMAHCTEGKRVFTEGHLRSNPHMGAPGGDRYWKEHQLYCTAFVGGMSAWAQSYRGVCSLRRLQVGPHAFWIEYRSTEGWMSNHGDGSATVVGVEKDSGYHPAIRYPLFAIDFVLGREMWAVDFNTSPGIRGSGVEKHLSAPQAVEAIKAAKAADVWEGQAK